jgi:hypothetical protein
VLTLASKLEQRQVTFNTAPSVLAHGEPVVGAMLKCDGDVILTHVGVWRTNLPGRQRQAESLDKHITSTGFWKIYE